MHVRAGSAIHNDCCAETLKPHPQALVDVDHS
jgi:hypothetical protein